MAREERLRRQFERLIEGSAFYEWLNIHPVAVEPGRVVGAMEYDDRLAISTRLGPDSIHGGIVATLVDVTGVGCTLTILADPADASVATTELDVTYNDPAKTDLRAEAVVASVEDGTVRVSVDVRRADDPDGEPIAEGEVVCWVGAGGPVLDAHRDGTD
jgi:uncharacterized protein (TIGR00369 family)